MFDPLPLAGDDAAELRSLLPDGCDVLMVDHYGLDETFERGCRGWAGTVAVIDDLANRRHDCDLLLDQTAGREAVEYLPLVPAGCEVVTGSQWALVRRPFRDARPAALERRRNYRGLRNILVTFGSYIPAPLADLILAGLAEARLNCERIDIVNPRPSIAPPAGLPVVVHSVVADMAAAMAAADLALTAAGSTTWERCCLGLPGVLAILADNQATIAENLVHRGATLSLGWLDTVTPAAVAAAVKAAGQPDTYARLSQASAALCDGMGAARLADRIAV